MKKEFFITLSLLFIANSVALPTESPLRYLEYLQEGPLKKTCTHCPPGCCCWFRSREEKARNWIIDILRFHNDPSTDKPVTEMGSMLAAVPEVRIMVIKLETAVRILLPDESDAVKQHEEDMVVQVCYALRKRWRQKKDL